MLNLQLCGVMIDNIPIEVFAIPYIYISNLLLIFVALCQKKGKLKMGIIKPNIQSY